MSYLCNWSIWDTKIRPWHFLYLILIQSILYADEFCSSLASQRADCLFWLLFLLWIPLSNYLLFYFHYIQDLLGLHSVFYLCCLQNSTKNVFISILFCVLVRPRAVEIIEMFPMKVSTAASPAIFIHNLGALPDNNTKGSYHGSAVYVRKACFVQYSNILFHIKQRNDNEMMKMIKSVFHHVALRRAL